MILTSVHRLSPMRSLGENVEKCQLILLEDLGKGRFSLGISHFIADKSFSTIVENKLPGKTMEEISQYFYNACIKSDLCYEFTRVYIKTENIWNLLDDVKHNFWDRGGEPCQNMYHTLDKLEKSGKFDFLSVLGLFESEFSGREFGFEKLIYKNITLPWGYLGTEPIEPRQKVNVESFKTHYLFGF